MAGLNFFAPLAMDLVGNLINKFQFDEENRRQEELFGEFRGPIEDIAGRLSGTEFMSPGAIEERLQGITPGGAFQSAFDARMPGGPLPSFNLGGFMGGMQGATQGALGTLGATSGQVFDIFNRSGSAIDQAIGEARDVLQGGRTADTLALGQRINELSGLNELFNTAAPTAELEAAGLASRRAQQIAGQQLGAMGGDEGVREALMADIGSQFSAQGQAAAERVRAFNRAIADTRSGILQSTSIPLEQINAALTGQEAGVLGQQAAIQAGQAQALGGLTSGLGQAAAGVQQATIPALLSALTQSANIDLAGRAQGLQEATAAGEAARQAELDPFNELQLILSAQGAAAGPQQAAANILLSLLDRSPTPLIQPFGQPFATSAQQIRNRALTSASQQDMLF